MKRMRSVTRLDARGKRILVRLDLDVEVKNNMVVDDTRLKAAISTLKLLLKQKASIILIGHRGRPHGKTSQDLSLKPVCVHLARLLKQKIEFATEFNKITPTRKNKIIMLENLRFNFGEESSNKSFAQKLASLADAYVNESFATSHENHASIALVPKYLQGYAGIQFEKEVASLDKLKNPEKPFMIIIGGAKAHDKIPILKQLSKKADMILLGGVMANTFLAANGMNTGNSIVNKECFAAARRLMKTANILMPVDVVVKIDKNTQIVSTNSIPKKAAIQDIGPVTTIAYQTKLRSAKTILWNGPLGIAEKPEFAHSTIAIAKYISKLKATTIITGGDTDAVIHKLGLAKKFTHLSTGGGAALALLSGETLAGIAALNNSCVSFKKARRET